MQRPKTYETKFREWGDEFSKNQKAALWKVMGAKVRKREKQGKKTSVYVHGNLIPKSKLRREIARYSFESTMDKYCLGIPNAGTIRSEITYTFQHRVRRPPKKS